MAYVAPDQRSTGAGLNTLSTNPDMVFKQAEQVVSAMLSNTQATSEMTGQNVQLQPDEVKLYAERSVWVDEASEALKMDIKIPHSETTGLSNIADKIAETLYQIPLIKGNFERPAPKLTGDAIRANVTKLLAQPNRLSPEQAQGIIAWDGFQDGYQGWGKNDVTKSDTDVITAKFNVEVRGQESLSSKEVQDNINARLPAIKQQVITDITALNATSNPPLLSQEELTQLKDIKLVTADVESERWKEVRVHFGMDNPKAKECKEPEDKLCASPLASVPHEKLSDIINNAVIHTGVDAHKIYHKIADKDIVTQDLRKGFVATGLEDQLETVLADQHLQPARFMEKNDRKSAIEVSYREDAQGDAHFTVKLDPTTRNQVSEVKATDMVKSIAAMGAQAGLPQAYHMPTPAAAQDAAPSEHVNPQETSVVDNILKNIGLQ